MGKAGKIYILGYTEEMILFNPFYKKALDNQTLLFFYLVLSSSKFKSAKALL